jgi:FkbM family methyltransferase
VVALRRRLDPHAARAIEGARALGRGTLARRLAAAGVVLFGDRIGRRRAALGRTALVQDVLHAPVVFTDRFGVRYLLYPSDAVYESFLHEGYYEEAEQRFCADYLEPGMTVFDVGASHGFHTLLFAKLAAPGAVHAFEPEEWNFHRLQTNLSLNGYGNVVAHRLAVFEQPGELELNVFPHELYGWHTFGAPTLEVEGELAKPVGQQTVTAVTLDDYCREHGIERIDLLKLDVEGAELEVLRGSAQLLREGRIGCLLFEISRQMVTGMGHDPGEVLDLVRGAHLSVHELNDDGTLRPAPERPSRDFENFVALG